MTEQKPIGYFFINDHGNWEQGTGTDGTPLYEHPAPDVSVLVEALKEAVYLLKVDEYSKYGKKRIYEALAKWEGRQ